jgi:hypothetical protein
MMIPTPALAIAALFAVSAVDVIPTARLDLHSIPIA